MTAPFHVGCGDQNKNSKQDNRTYDNDNDDDYWRCLSTETVDFTEAIKHLVATPMP